VGSDIQRGLNGDLKRVRRKTFFANVGVNARGLGQRSQLAHAGFDKGELLFDQIGIGHGAAR
jgi:hypothetical protein